MKRLNKVLASVVAVISLTTVEARAGRGGAEIILNQFAEGYGVVAAEVIESESSPLEDDDRTFGVKCRVKSVIADTVRIHTRLKLKAGDTFFVVLTVGYGAQIENWGGTDRDGNVRPGDKDDGPLDKGAKFYLTIRPADFGTFEHAHGSSAAIRVFDFSKKTNARYARLREIANLPFDRRWDESLKMTCDPTADTEIRRQTLLFLADKRAQIDEATTSERVATAREQLRRLWRDQGQNMQIDLLNTLDWALGFFDWKEFPASADREKIWFLRAFAPLPATARKGTPELRDRSELVQSVQRLADAHPQDVGLRLCSELNKQTWPFEFRRGMACTLMRMYVYDKQPNERWATALQEYFRQAIQNSTDPCELRIWAADLTWSALDAPSEGGKLRSLHPPLTLAALVETKIKELKANIPADDQQGQTAITELKEVLQKLKATAAPEN